MKPSPWRDCTRTPMTPRPIFNKLTKPSRHQGASRFDGSPYAPHLTRRQIVHDDDVAGSEFGRKDLAD